MKKTISADEIQELKQQLHRVRQQSLLASRENDFRTVARLTAEAAQINRTIQCQEDFADCGLKSLTVVNALAKFDDESHFVFPEEPTGAKDQKLLPTFQEAA
jgi:hypothetical protein